MFLSRRVVFGLTAKHQQNLTPCLATTGWNGRYIHQLQLFHIHLMQIDRPALRGRYTHLHTVNHVLKVLRGGKKSLEYQLDFPISSMCVCVCDLAVCPVAPRAAQSGVLLRIIPESLKETHTNPASPRWDVHQTTCRP